MDAVNLRLLAIVSHGKPDEGKGEVDAQ